MFSPVATGSPSAKIAATTAAAPAIARSPAPPTASAAIPGPIAEPGAAPSTMISTQNHPQQQRRESRCHEPQWKTRKLSHHESQDRSQHCARAPETLAQDEASQKSDENPDDHILEGACPLSGSDPIGRRFLRLIRPFDCI